LHLFETPRKQSRSILPDAPFAVAEHDYNDITPRHCSAGDETMACRFGVTGFHPVTKRKALEHFVGVLQLARPPTGITKNKSRQANDRADGRVRVSSARNNREVTRS